METLLSSLAILSRWDVIAALLVGSIGGVVIGAIPGVGLWGAVVQTILGYGGLGLLLARRQVITASAPVSQNPLS